jgi:hypothetical protein
LRFFPWRTAGIGSGTVAAEVNGDAKVTQLPGSIDWDRLVSSGGGIGGLAQPPGPGFTTIDEPAPTELIENRELLERGAATSPTPQTRPPAGASPVLPTVKKCKKGFRLKKVKKKGKKPKKKCVKRRRKK